jgi:hypothetical protein
MLSKCSTTEVYPQLYCSSILMPWYKMIFNIFYVFICHLNALFCEISFHAFSLFSNCASFLLFSFQLSEFFVHSTHSSLSNTWFVNMFSKFSQHPNRIFLFFWWTLPYQKCLYTDGALGFKSMNTLSKSFKDFLLNFIFYNFYLYLTYILKSFCVIFV